MEGSKVFAKQFMDRHSIPTAAFRSFSSSEFDQAVEYVKTCGFKVVLKTSGLAAGKGVLIPETTDDAINGLREIMVNSVFGAAGLHPYYANFEIPENSVFLNRKRSSDRGIAHRA